MTTTRSTTLRELTIRSVVLGGLITLIFTAANVYLGLKVGLTVRHRHPGRGDLHGHPALLPRPLDPREQHRPDDRVGGGHPGGHHLRAARPDHDRLVAGLPVLDHVAVCVIGGTLGVMYSVPLRRALVTGSDLPYPEGVAAAEVLKVGEASGGGREENRKSLRAILVAALVAAGFSLLAALKVISNEISTGVPGRVGRHPLRGQPVAGASSVWGTSSASRSAPP
jgi:hypothetical protein